jgi:Na+/pantothenate symporter
VAERGRTWGWTLTEALISYGVSLVGFAAFVAVETRYRDSALLPLHLFRRRTFTVGVLASMVVGVGMFGGLLLPQYLQVVKGVSPTVAGFQMLPLVLGMLITAATAGTRPDHAADGPRGPERLRSRRHGWPPRR